MFSLERFDPLTFSDASGVVDETVQSGLVALHIENKYLFVDDEGRPFHEYVLPANPDVYQLGGYVGKIVYYRDPELLAYLRQAGVSRASFDTDRYPILRTQSPLLDLLLHRIIRQIQGVYGSSEVSLFDLGCTVAEHYDLLQTMLKAEAAAPPTLKYTGLDRSALLLSVARMLHADVPSEQFSLLNVEGSAFDVAPNSFDVSFSMGVVNHVHNPQVCLPKLIRATRKASALALWITNGPEGMWTLNHSGVPFYLFSSGDLKAIEAELDGEFYVWDFIPMLDSTQPKSFIGMRRDALERTASYQLCFCRDRELAHALDLPRLLS